MLVHKGTLGVLEQVWRGAYRQGPDGRREPAYHAVTLSDYPDVDPEDWWEIPNQSALARKLRRYAPWAEAITGPDGALIDIQPIKEQTPAAEKDYRKNARRPTGVMPFLDAPEKPTYPRTTGRGAFRLMGPDLF